MNNGTQALEYSFAAKDADGNVVSFGVVFADNGYVRIRTSDKTKTVDHLVQWANDRWHQQGERVVVDSQAGGSFEYRATDPDE